MCGLSVPVALRAGWKLMPRNAQDALKDSRDEHLAVVNDDHLGDDDRAGRCVLQALVDAEHPPERQGGHGHLHGLGPAGAHRLRGDGPASSTLASTDLVVGRSRRGHRPGRDVDDPGEVHPVRDSVIKADQDVQRCRVDLHQVTGCGHRHLPERPLGTAASDRRVR